MDAKQIGERIRQHRKNKKITQTQLGAGIGVDKVTIANYESGKIKVIPFEKRAKMSSVLNIPVGELLYDNEKMACISTNEAVDELRENRLIKAVNESWKNGFAPVILIICIRLWLLSVQRLTMRQNNERTDYFTVAGILGRQNRVYTNNLLCSRPCSNCVCRDGCNGSLDR